VKLRSIHPPISISFIPQTKDSVRKEPLQSIFFSTS
jgi:hypothetical protein